MSIIIKGMDMPKSCWECEIFGCSLRDKLAHIEDRNPDCPLVEIPTPHGRLIDEDNIKIIAVQGQGIEVNAITILEAEE